MSVERVIVNGDDYERTVALHLMPDNGTRGYSCTTAPDEFADGLTITTINEVGS